MRLARLHIVALLLIAVRMSSQVSTDSIIRQQDRTIKEHDRLIQGVLDSLRKIKIQVSHLGQDLTFTGTSAISRSERMAEEPRLTIGGYVSAYYAHYSDSMGYNAFQKFPTAAPRSDAFALNLVQLSTKYSSRTVRAIATFHYGDMPASVWSPVYNYLQEVNAGIRIHRKLWLDAGFFRTHIGLESIQPRENITTNLSIVTFNDPYYLAGAKLSFLASDKLVLQVNAFNSYNGFTENNKKKALGFSALYDVNSKLTLAVNTLWNDDASDTAKLALGRLYNDFYMVYKTTDFVFGLEANYGLQQNTQLNSKDPRGHTAQMYSVQAAAKYRMLKKLYVYGKAEYYNDPDEMLSGPILDNRSQYVDLKIAGATLGLEWKPVGNAYLRVESRILKTTDEEEIFRMNGVASDARYEVISELGVWF
jgi:hypothetical protein